MGLGMERKDGRRKRERKEMRKRKRGWEEEEKGRSGKRRRTGGHAGVAARETIRGMETARASIGLHALLVNLPCRFIQSTFQCKFRKFSQSERLPLSEAQLSGCETLH
jgi:hypothetical protein